MIKIKELRKTAGLTQENAAKKLNISRQVFANYENEINQPSPEMLCEIADLFNCSIDYLVGREDEDGAIMIYGVQEAGSSNLLTQTTSKSDEHWVSGSTDFLIFY